MSSASSSSSSSASEVDAGQIAESITIVRFSQEWEKFFYLHHSLNFRALCAPLSHPAAGLMAKRDSQSTDALRPSQRQVLAASRNRYLYLVGDEDDACRMIGCQYNFFSDTVTFSEDETKIESLLQATWFIFILDQFDAKWCGFSELATRVLKAK